MGRKLADILSRPAGLISMQGKERRGSPLKSQLLAHMMGGETWRDLLAKANQKT